MPYPNEHAVRITNPDKYVRIRRQNDKFGPGIDVIFGINEDGTTEVQAIRFDKTKFTPSEAREWLAEHDYEPIEFVEATKEISMEEIVEECKMPLDVTSFAQLEDMQEAQGTVMKMADLTKAFMQMSDNILNSPMVEDKAGAMQNLTSEYQERLGAVGKKEVEHEEITDELDEKAVWTTKYVNDLPDSAFMYIVPGGEKDEEGKTKPRNFRKFPIKDKSGKVDLPHLQNAIARIPQSNAPGLTAEKKKQLQEKARRMLQKETKGILETVKGWIDELKALINPQKEERAVKTFKGPDGRTWLVIYSTNAFVDREKELFTTQSIDDFIERHKDGHKGEFWFWHHPGTKFSDIKLQSKAGRFLMEAGPFDDTLVGQTLEKLFTEYPNGHPILAPTGWGSSHGYKYHHEDREDGVYEWFDKHESSVLSALAASNPHNPGFKIPQEEQKLMDEKQRQDWENVFGKDFVDHITKVAETKTAELEEAGVAFKAVETETEETTTEEKDVEETVVEETVVEETVVEIEEETKDETTEETTDEVTEEQVEETTEEKAITRDEIVEAMKSLVDELESRISNLIDEKIKEAVNTELEETVDGLMDIVAPIAHQVKNLSLSDEQKIAGALPDIPSASLQDMVKSSLFGEETKVHGNSALAKDGPKETVIESGEYPKMAGVSLKLWS